MLTEEEYSNEYDLDGIRSKKVSVVTKYNINSGSGGGTVLSGGNSIQGIVKPPINQPEKKLISKTTKTHTYLTQNGKVIRETLSTTVLQTKITRKTEILDFIYDESGRPFALIYTNGAADPVTYYYVLNLQGDVVALTDDTGAIVAEYVYNAWGEKLHILDSDGNEITSSSNIAIINPLRYRGYYYDTETGWYYLQSRYYDPANHRFINADGLASTGKGSIGCNMYAYCNNNPSSFSDSCGTVPVSVEIATVTETIPINDDWDIVVSVSWDASFGDDAISLLFGKDSFTVSANAETGENTSLQVDYSFCNNSFVEGTWGPEHVKFIIKVDASGVSGGVTIPTKIGDIKCNISITLKYNSSFALFKHMLKRAASSLGGTANPYGGNGQLLNGMSFGVYPIQTVGGSVFPWLMQIK